MCRPLIPSSLSHTKSVVIFKTTNMITCSFMFKNVKRNYVLLIKSKQKMCMLSFFEHFPSLNTFAHVQSIAKGNTTMLRVQCNAECCKVCCHKQLLPVIASAYRSAFPLHTYKPDIARLRLLQMPLACICLGNLKQGTSCWYLVEYVQGVDCEVCMLCECFANYQSISISAH